MPTAYWKADRAARVELGKLTARGFTVRERIYERGKLRVNVARPGGKGCRTLTLCEKVADDA
jgi:hypothetical protein